MFLRLFQAVHSTYRRAFPAPIFSDAERTRLAGAVNDINSVTLIVFCVYLAQALIFGTSSTPAYNIVIAVFIGWLGLMKIIIDRGRPELAVVGLAIGMGCLYLAVSLAINSPRTLTVLVLALGVMAVTMPLGFKGAAPVLVAYVALMFLTTQNSLDKPPLPVKPWTQFWTGALILVSLTIICAILREHLIDGLARALKERDAAQAELELANARLSKMLSEEHQNLVAAQGDVRQKAIDNDRLANMTQFGAAVAHELGTPIGSATLAASALSDWAKDHDRIATWEQVQEASELILRNLRKANELMAGFKQQAFDQLADNRRTLDLSEHIEHCLRLLKPNMASGRVQAFNKVPSGILMSTFPGTLQQVVANLVMNSIKHGFKERRDGEIRVEGRSLPGDRVELRISDNGRGIPANIQSEVFQSMFTTDRAGGSSGLGLFIVSQLVKDVLSGTIELHSGPPAPGTVMVLNLARNSPEPHRSEGAGGAFA